MTENTPPTQQPPYDLEFTLYVCPACSDAIDGDGLDLGKDIAQRRAMAAHVPALSPVLNGFGHIEPSTYRASDGSTHRVPEDSCPVAPCEGCGVWTYTRYPYSVFIPAEYVAR